MPKALLILFGGRSIPNVLTMIHEKPDLLVAIVSENYKHEIDNFKKLVDILFPQEKPVLDVSFEVSAFNVQNIRDQCEKAVKKHPGYEWIFNVTSGTALMSIGAYEAARNLSGNGYTIDCWYMDTENTRVVSLFDKETPNEAIYDISVKQYVAAYNYRLEPGSVGDQRKLAEDKWLPFAYNLVQQPENIDLLKELTLEKIREDRRRKEERKAASSSAKASSAFNPHVYSFDMDGIYPLLDLAYNVGLINKLTQRGKTITIEFSPQQFGFLNGAWLEVYVWKEISKLNKFTYCQWNQQLYPLHDQTTKENLNELDVSMIHKAKMFFVECKAGKEAFEAKTLSAFDSLANTLGGRFVTKILVTSCLEKNDQKDKDHFTDLLKARHIFLITRKDLGQVGELITAQIEKPAHVRG